MIGTERLPPGLEESSRSPQLSVQRSVCLQEGANLRDAAASFNGPVYDFPAMPQAAGTALFVLLIVQGRWRGRVTPHLRITRVSKFSISSSCGLNCNSSRSAPAASNAATCSLTCSAVPTRPERSPRFDTE